VGISGRFFNLVSASPISVLAELDRLLKCIEADNGCYAPGSRGLPCRISTRCCFGQLVALDGLILPREILKNAFALAFGLARLQVR
jgi:2-amino-4-hydroxy-6-hydroxymethyldihydropteridine diphosphokinase